MLNGKYSFNNSVMKLDNVSLESLNGVVNLKGDVNFTQVLAFKSLFPKIDLELDVQNFSFNYPEGLNGSWEGDLFFKGEDLPYLLNGTMFLDNGQFLKDFESLKYENKVKNDNLQGYINLDLNLKSKNEVLIKNDLFEGNLVFDLNITGSELNPKSEGKLNIINGQIFYNNNVFKVNAGKIELLKNNTNLYQIDSEAKIGDYQVFLQINGENNDYELNIYSVPSLNETELVSLLAMGELNSEFNTDSSEYSLDFGQSTLADRFSITKGLKDEAGIKVKFKYNKDTISTTPSIQLEKKFTNDLKLKFQKSLDESINKQEINVQYDINRNAKIRFLLEEDNSDENKKDSTKAGFDFRFKFEF